MGSRSFLLLLSLLLFSNTISGKGKYYTYNVLDTFPHDPQAFTQGLIVHPDDPDYFIEGTGLYSSSELRKVRIADGEVVQRYELNSRHFGEGVTYFGGYYYQLTWKSTVVYKYLSDGDWTTGEPLTFTWGSATQQGWGLTEDGEHMIVSDGSQYIRFVDKNFDEVRKIRVKDQYGADLKKINELEYIEGEIWANVWFQDSIYVINPKSGEVTKVVDLSGMHKKESSSEDVLNGIAYNPVNGTLYVTGKKWPTMYEIEVVQQIEDTQDGDDDGNEEGEGD
eukprot:CAMPEP_0201515694 /NCGR_PEP_ID=MMETSP0161_2-20130828/7196_1 /ASSEMBLY_ACC=CAM_ASM_000251 /TAXON_ID=180227 /ORGANISM="Neoparamoeba aestuarina, Strain SoJaBio B1-5/56/2" /LENGTH=278 /DNA_ID=CAMNT_0047912595 /DNA_START=145 /DNA_END=978 /DNA_ORIENTATION=-